MWIPVSSDNDLFVGNVKLSWDAGEAAVGPGDDTVWAGLNGATLTATYYGCGVSCDDNIDGNTVIDSTTVTLFETAPTPTPSPTPSPTPTPTPTPIPIPIYRDIGISSATLESGLSAIMGAAITGGVGSYSAQIDWGDGTTESGTVSGSKVMGQHTYGSIGTYTTTITVTDSASTQASDSGVFNVVGTNASIAIPSVTVWGLAGAAAVMLMLFGWRVRHRRAR